MKVFIGPYATREQADNPDWNRQIDIHIDGYDAWNMDNTLALIIVPLLKEFKKQGNGFPSEFSKDYGDGTEERGWNKILDKMIWAFEQVTNDSPVSFLPEIEQKKVQEGINLFAKYYLNMWN